VPEEDAGGRGSGEVNRRNVVVDERSWCRPDDGVRGHGWAAAGLVSDQSRGEEELARRALCSICPVFALYRVGKSETAGREKIAPRWDPARRGSSSSLSLFPHPRSCWDANAGTSAASEPDLPNRFLSHSADNGSFSLLSDRGMRSAKAWSKSRKVRQPSFDTFRYFLNARE
jgi:hypothetical protein